MNKQLSVLVAIVFFFLSTKISEAQTMITSSVPQHDFCFPATITFTIINPSPTSTFKWFTEDNQAFEFAGTTSNMFLGNGTSIITDVTTLTDLSACSNITAIEYDAQMNIINTYGYLIGSTNTFGPGGFPYYYSTYGCQSLSIPVSFFELSVSGRYGMWYKDGIATGNNYIYIDNISTGNYEYKLKLACGDTISTGLINVQNYAAIPPVISASSSSICNGDTAILSVSANYNGYYWKKDGVTVSSTSGATYKATLPGNYSVETYRTSGGSTTCYKTSNTIAITVLNAAFITASDTATCSGDSVLLQCQAANSYVWKKNGAVMAGRNSQNIYVKSAGDYQVITTGLQCNISKIKHISFYINPTVSITSSTVNICVGTGTELSASGNNISSYLWTKSNSAIDAATVPSIYVTKSGVYCCEVKNAIGCKRTSSPITITASLSNTLPLKTVSFQPGSGGDDTFIESYLSNQFLNFGNQPYFDVSSWAKGLHTLDRGLLKFNLSTIPQGALITNASLKVYIDSLNYWTLPIQKLLIRKLTQNWTESTVTWNSGFSFIDYQRQIIPHDSIAENVFVKANITDFVNYWIKNPSLNYGMMLSTDENTSSASFIRIPSGDNAMASHRPKLTVSYTYADIIADGSLTFCAGDSVKLTTNSGAYTYKWFKNNNVIASATNVNYKAKSAGTYYVVISNATGCTAKSATVTVSVPCRMSNYENEISISPNPSSDNFTLTSENGSALNNLKVFDTDGRLIEIIDHLESGSMIGNNWSPGVYVITGDQTKRMKLVKL